MSDDAEGRARRRRFARFWVTIGGMSALTGAGIAIFALVPTNAPNAFVPCSPSSGLCTMVLTPNKAECQLFMSRGGDSLPEDPGPDGGPDPLSGSAGRLPRIIRAALEHGVIEGLRVEQAAPPADGGVQDCCVFVRMDKDQRAAAIASINAQGVGSDVVDGRFANVPAKCKRNGVLRNVAGGQDPGGAGEALPDAGIESLDGGPE